MSKRTVIPNTELLPKAGLYLNEQNRQTFEIVEAANGVWAYVALPDFFYCSEVYTDVRVSDLVKMILKGEITFIGEV